MDVKVFAVSRNEFQSESELALDSCRLCMSRSTAMKPLFDKRSEDIVEMIRFSTGVELKNESDLPSQICESCFEDLSIAHEFKKLCLSADETFRKYMAFHKKSKLHKNRTCLETLRPTLSKEDNNRKSNVSDSDDNYDDALQQHTTIEMVIEGEVVKEEMLEEQEQNLRRESDSSSDSDAEENVTPPEMLEMTVEMPSEIPEKSRKKYEKCYESFRDWTRTKNTTSFSEAVLLEYFQELSDKFKSSTLWSTYSMLKSTLIINDQVDLSKYSKLLALLKRKSKGYQGKKSKTFSSGEINKFLKEAPDEVYLSTKIALIFGIMGACRRQELYNLQFKDVQVYGSTIFVKITNTKTKTDRSFTITGKYYEICMRYIRLRPDSCINPSFFLNYKLGKCTSQSVGINKFGNQGKAIAKYLNLPNPDLYTGHCFRRTSATILVDAEGDILNLKRYGRWRSPVTSEGYIEDSMSNRIHSVELNSDLLRKQ